MNYIDLLLKSSWLWNYFKWLFKNFSVYHETIENFIKTWINSRESSKSSKNCFGTVLKKKPKGKSIFHETIDHLNCTPTTPDLWHKYNGTQYMFDQDYSIREVQSDHKYLDPYPSCSIAHEMECLFIHRCFKEFQLTDNSGEKASNFMDL